MLIRLFNPNDLIGCGGNINQSKSVPMMSLNVVGNINQSNSRGLHRSPRVVSAGGLLGRSLWVSTGGFHGRSLWMVSVGLHGRSVDGLCRWSQWVVSTGGLCEGSPWVVYIGFLCQ